MKSRPVPSAHSCSGNAKGTKCKAHMNFRMCTFLTPFCLLPQPLDYEISAFHTLLIKVENEDPLVPDVSYGPSSTATVHITVLDVNEGPVFYPDPMMVTKQENISVGSVLLTVNATDPDSLQHQTIRWVSYSGSTDRSIQETAFLFGCQSWSLVAGHWL